MEPEPTTKAAQVVGRYALYEAIAAGGMATVHFGRLLGPVGFSRTVAIKRLHAQFARDPEFVSMFLDEARLAARIRHPNVVPTLDVVATDGELFLVMEYVSGESLAKLVRTAAGQGTVIPPRIVIAVMCGVLRGLHAAHEATNERGEPLGIVHRDVSPQNVLVGIDGQARVLDFGVAKAAGRLQTTRDGKLKGKLAYMSPEQLRGKPIDRRTDVFAASTVLWEALTGRRLFRGDNEGAIITKILDGSIDAPSTALPQGEVDEPTLALIRAVDAIVVKGLATSLDVRWESARAMAIALEKAVPPAGVSEVSEWVEHFAKDVLVSRAQQVAEIESNSAVGPASLRAIRDSTAALESVPSPRASEPRVSNPSLGSSSSPSSKSIGAVLAEDSTRSAPVDLSTIAVASQARVSGLPPKRRGTGRIVAVVGLVGAVAIFVALRALPSSRVAAVDPSAPPSPSAHAAAAPTVAPSASVTSAESVTAAASAPPSAVTPPPAVPRTGTGTAVVASLPPPPAAPAVAPAPHPAGHGASAHGGGAAPQAAAPSVAAGCNPPFSYDAQGLKHFKPECL